MMIDARRILLACTLTLLAACSGGQDPVDAEPVEQTAEAEEVEAEEVEAEEVEAEEEEIAQDEPDAPPTSPNPESLAGEGSAEGDALCVRNCKGWQLCAGEENLGPEFGLENCVEQCEATQQSACGGEFEAFVDCALQQSCDRWMASGGDRLEGCEQEFDDAMACMAGMEAPPTMEQ